MDEAILIIPNLNENLKIEKIKIILIYTLRKKLYLNLFLRI